uniref:PDZ domain-containing protein n=1 Tax=Trieres chinensis TaxID=1514140 RepID=A0A7S1ZCW4_TRICV|mmetsp:Transcript_22811/g.46305  ORF Transcript_22811/g.46305 Transcript_22811/m.46305 type:complete len:342 (+) Transcript_22811:54-1079(+)|eukprot:CAMPEP_0183306726 /NCGR_PEP_ID=MMETSP0160_2-20130417/13551_1 /TAXON_ID=2839 ORGANISM="Odontella Sinensis, Strain Grunow 1884" /NCGR_SAMPLE_ID=MMETSP0160_2 /ASSEMBLY_ACC=CAM_ASM_000250 /LENGTH=341 /DNA_ID=CAMNT_0025470171 /DNA_START=54 /DNA_END=1079 /DNA_ORIENTATION=-
MFRKQCCLAAVASCSVFLPLASSFSIAPPRSHIAGSKCPPLLAAPAESDFERPRTVVDNKVVDANVYNVALEDAVELWTASVSAERSADREANVPYLDSKSKDHFVDDVEVTVPRDGGLGMELLEIAGGRDDGYGITVVTAVTEGGNAERAGVVPGDSIATVVGAARAVSSGGLLDVEETEEAVNCECRDFDSTIAALTAFPAEVEELNLGIKRLRRWPKVKVVVEYPPSQCAEGVDNKETLELFAGENLRRALLNRGIVMEDSKAPKCDFCGGKCTVSVDVGFDLLNPMSTTEEKLMAKNPKCRLSCKSTVGYNMQEGSMRLRINLNQWSKEDRRNRLQY